MTTEVRVTTTQFNEARARVDEWLQDGSSADELTAILNELGIQLILLRDGLEPETVASLRKRAGELGEWRSAKEIYEQVFELLWQSGEQTFQGIRDRVPLPPLYLDSILDNLRHEGIVTRVRGAVPGRVTYRLNLAVERSAG